MGVQFDARPANYHNLMLAAPPKTADYVLGLGSNMGDRLANLRAAISGLNCNNIQVLARSLVYQTAPWGPPQPDYFNAAVRVRSPVSASELLALTMTVETSLGRVRPDAIRWGPRTIDIDMLWFAGGTINTAALTVPHPRLRERAFALRPLLDVAPEACDPATGQPYRDLTEAQFPLREVAPL